MPAVRSRLRIGQMRLSDDGIHIAGIETKPNDAMDARCGQVALGCIAGGVLPGISGVFVPVHDMTLNKLEPQTVAALSETIPHFAPGAVCRKTEQYEWAGARLAVLAFFVVILCAMLGGVICLVLSH